MSSLLRRKKKGAPRLTKQRSKSNVDEGVNPLWSSSPAAANRPTNAKHGTQWKRSEEAELIMQMLKVEARKMDSGEVEERNTIPVEVPIEEPTPESPVHEELDPILEIKAPEIGTRSMPSSITPTTSMSEFSDEDNSPFPEIPSPSRGSEENFQENTEPEKTEADSPVIWRRNPEAEKIMMMLKLEAERDLNNKVVRNTIEVEVAPPPPPEETSPSTPRDDKKFSKFNLSTSSSMSARIFKQSRTKETFTISRSNGEEDAGLDALGKEFAAFKASPLLSVRSANSGDSDVSSTEGEPQMDRRTQIVLEIRASERSYVSVLTTLKDDYYATLIANIKKGKITDITENTIKQIFSNISLITNVNQMLFSEIDARVNEWDENQTIGDVFLDIIPYLKIYDQYGNNFDNSCQVLKECEKNVSFAAALEQIENTTETNLRIESLLIAPIQRLPRYILLLGDLKRKTAETHPDWEHLVSAIPAMQSVADHVDKNIQKARNKQKLVELSSGGATSLLLAHRNLIFETEIRCENLKKPTSFYVFNDLLVHLSTAKAKHKPNLTAPEAQWPLHLIWFQYPSIDCVQVLGPTDDVYLIRVGNDNSLLLHLNNAVDAALLKQHQKRSTDKEMEIPTAKNTKERYGSYSFPNTTVYEGDWFNGMMHGKGKWTYLDHEYEGEFSHGQKSGKGTMKYFSGEIYSGEWENDLPSGKGELLHPSGDKYEGSFGGGAKHGYGAMTFANGDVFDGYWVQNKPEGLGTFNYHNGIVYSGNFKNGRFHSYGVLSCSKTGKKYEGEWSTGFREGKGRLEYADGSVYDGFWANGLKSGKGKFVSTNEGTYDGDWVDDLKHGKGTMEFKCGNVYTGNWQGGKFHGNGKLIYSSGSIRLYEGGWANNKKSGHGAMYFCNGNCFEGTFKNDLMSGTGTFTYANGLVLSGKWENDTLEGKTTVSTMYKNQTDQQTIHGDLESNQWTVAEKPPLHFHSVPVLPFESW